MIMVCSHLICSISVFFERRTKYDCIVYMCRVPNIVLYVHNLVQSIRPWIQRVHNVLRFYI